MQNRRLREDLVRTQEELLSERRSRRLSNAPPLLPPLARIKTVRTKELAGLEQEEEEEEEEEEEQRCEDCSAQMLLFFPKLAPIRTTLPGLRQREIAEAEAALKQAAMEKQEEKEREIKQEEMEMEMDMEEEKMVQEEGEKEDPRRWKRRQNVSCLMLLPEAAAEGEGLQQREEMDQRGQGEGEGLQRKEGVDPRGPGEAAGLWVLLQEADWLNDSLEQKLKEARCRVEEQEEQLKEAQRARDEGKMRESVLMQQLRGLGSTLLDGRKRESDLIQQLRAAGGALAEGKEREGALLQQLHGVGRALEESRDREGALLQQLRAADWEKRALSDQCDLLTSEVCESSVTQLRLQDQLREAQLQVQVLSDRCRVVEGEAAALRLAATEGGNPLQRQHRVWGFTQGPVEGAWQNTAPDARSAARQSDAVASLKQKLEDASLEANQQVKAFSYHCHQLELKAQASELRAGEAEAALKLCSLQAQESEVRAEKAEVALEQQRQTCLQAQAWAAYHAQCNQAMESTVSSLQQENVMSVTLVHALLAVMGKRVALPLALPGGSMLQLPPIVPSPLLTLLVPWVREILPTLADDNSGAVAGELVGELAAASGLASSDGSSAN